MWYYIFKLINQSLKESAHTGFFFVYKGGVTMANEQNLRPVRNKKEARERGKAGGKRSGEVRRQRKTLKEELLLLLASGNTQEKMSLSMIQEALNGNVKAFETIRDTIGEKPIDKAEVKTEVTTVNVVLEEDEE